MPLTPEGVRTWKFGTTRFRRGYDHQEVDAFLELVEEELVDRDIQAEQVRGTRWFDSSPEPPVEPSRQTGTGQVSVPSAAEGTLTAAARLLQMAAESSASAIAEARQEADRILSRARGEASTILSTARRQADQVTNNAQDRAAQLQRSVQERRDVAFRPLTRQRDELQRPITIAEVVGADPGPLIGKHDQIRSAPAPVSPPSLDEPPGQPRTAWHHQPAFMLTFGVVAIMLTISSVGYRLMQEPQTGPGGAAVTADSHASPLHIAGEHAGGPFAERAAAGSDPSAPAPAPTPVRPPDPGERQRRAHSIAPVNAVAFGPHGPGQGDNPHAAWLAIDGQRRTAWQSRRYTTARFGSLYPGTGLLLDMGNTVKITAVRVTLGAATGASFQIRIGNQPKLADLRPAASSAGPGGIVRMTLGRPVRGRYVLVWFTRLPPGPAGTYQAAVHGIGVKALGLMGPAAGGCPHVLVKPSGTEIRGREGWCGS